MSSTDRSPARGAPRAYALFCGVFLLLQGTSTLAARLFPAVDQAIPGLLATTHMRPVHSVLHIATALLAFAVVTLGQRATVGFAFVFGGFYTALGLFGWLSGFDFAALGLHLQPFDHPFHVLLGGLGLVAVAWARRAPSRSSLSGEGIS
jgi:hypothetical protein